MVLARLNRKPLERGTGKRTHLINTVVDLMSVDLNVIPGGVGDGS